MKRVMCVWLPNWPLQRIRYARPEHKTHTIVLFADRGQGGFYVVTCCESAARQGVAPEMPLAEAKGVLESTRSSRFNAPVFIEHNPDRDRTGLRGLAEWCQRFSPMVGIEQPDSLLLDLSGCTHLFGGERRLSNQFARVFMQWGLSVRTAIADTIGAAWAAAHFGKNHRAVIPPGNQEAVLRRLPTRALRLPASAVETLDELDVLRIEQLQALPRASLSSRFGSAVPQRLDQALGSVDELIVPVRPLEPIEAREDFEHSICHRQSLEIVLRQLVEQISAKVAETQHGIQQLEVRIVDPTKQSISFVVGTLRPSQSVEHLMDLVGTRLEQVMLAEEITGVHLKATTTAMMESHQSQLFDAGNNLNAERDFARLIDRMSNRLGKQQVVRPRLYPDAQPEFGVRWEPMLDADEIPKTQSFQFPQAWLPSSRPLCLRAKPPAIEVVSVVPDGPPLRFFWEQNTYTVARYWGPERIETGWWRERHVRRDYYRIETDGGQHFWLFRRIGQGDWFLHGEFE